MTESVAWQSIRKNLMREGIHIQRIEDSITPGIPDTNFCYKGHEFWLEGKFMKVLPKRDSSIVKVGLSPKQALWLTQRQRAGGACFVWVRVADLGWFLICENFIEYQKGIEKWDFLSCTPTFSNSKQMVKIILGET